MSVLSFEKPVYELETKIEELRSFGAEKKMRSYFPAFILIYISCQI